MQILILDDEPDLREIYKEEYMIFGHQVEVAANGVDGLLVLERFSFDFVLSDIKMPILDGVSFLKIAKARYPELPIFMVTGGSNYSREEIMAMGAAGIFEKTNISCKLIVNVATEWIASLNKMSEIKNA